MELQLLQFSHFPSLTLEAERYNLSPEPTYLDHR